MPVPQTAIHDWALLGVLLALIAAPKASAESADARFLAGLRERQLFELAEVYCADRLKRISPEEPAAADLTVEWIRTLSLHAVNAPLAERDPLWAKARSVAGQFLRRMPPNPRAVLVEVQDALTPLAQGELGRQESEVGLLPAIRLEPTREALREATRLLERLDESLTREIPLRRRTPPPTGGLSADQLFALQQHVQYQLARTQKNRALLFAEGSDDRSALLLAAIETLQRPLAQLDAGQTLAPLVQLELAECQRLAGRGEEAAQVAAQLDQDGAEPATRLLARAELLRIAAARGDAAPLQRLLGQGREIAGQVSVELDLARLEACLVLARDAAISGQFQAEATASLTAIEQHHGAQAAHRANQVLIRMLPTGEPAHAVLLGRKADGLFLRGDVEQAIAAYDAAADQAEAAGDTDAAFAADYKAALAEQHQRQHGEAAARLRSLAKLAPKHPQAPQAHWLAAWNAAQAVNADAAAALVYAGLLREHLLLWPQSPFAEEARSRLEKLKDWHPSQPPAPR